MLTYLLQFATMFLILLMAREYHIHFPSRMIEQNRSQALTLSKGQVLMSIHANTDFTISSLQSLDADSFFRSLTLQPRYMSVDTHLD
ncbi:hypothetical protein P692DRAFT_2028675 [Suillus brevipes Sb2]|jgi:hypothetical protein|nr:hypothetical protein P692DRAFT_2028675 [Suillus brevipes Sb2]